MSDSRFSYDDIVVPIPALKVQGKYRLAPGPAEEAMFFSFHLTPLHALIPPFGSSKLESLLSLTEEKRKEMDQLIEKLKLCQRPMEGMESSGQEMKVESPS